MHIKQQALKSRQSPLQKALTFSENALKVIGTAKGIFEAGKTVYDGFKAVTPMVEGVVSLML